MTHNDGITQTNCAIATRTDWPADRRQKEPSDVEAYILFPRYQKATDASFEARRKELLIIINN